jgi:cyanate permease
MMTVKDPAQRRKELETVVVIVLGLAVSSWLERRNLHRRNIFLCCAFLIGAAGLLLPPVAGRIYRFWMGLSRVLGGVTGRVLLTVVYILVLLPLSALARWRGKLSIRKKPDGVTHFKDRNHTYTKEDIIHPW